MFGLFKNKAIGYITDDLDSCIAYLTTSVGAQDKQKCAAQIINTLNYWTENIAEGKATYEHAMKYFMKLKTDFVVEHALEDCRNLEYAGLYIIYCFFVFLNHNKQQESRDGANRILGFIENNVESGLTAHVKKYTAIYRRMFV